MFKDIKKKPIYTVFFLQGGACYENRSDRGKSAGRTTRALFIELNISILFFELRCV